MISPRRLLQRAPTIVSSRFISDQAYIFTSDNIRKPQLPAGLNVVDVPLTPATDEEALAAVGAHLVSSRDEISIEKGNFDITPWPVSGWRQLDPDTGDEAGTTEGLFEVEWVGDNFFGHNLAIGSSSNRYLDGLGCLPEHASPHGTDKNRHTSDESFIYLWMSDYHPDGGQLFWPEANEDKSTAVPFVVCLGPASCGDDIRPEDMRAFAVPPGYGIYLNPGTWHNGVYVHRAAAPQGKPAQFLTRQGRVHARVSCSWAAEFGTLLRLKLPIE